MKSIPCVLKALALALLPGLCHADDAVIPADSLVKDFRVFCDALESAHPDPYSSFGGRPYFSEARDAMIERLYAGGLTAPQFCDLLNEFTVPLADLHTFVQYPQSDYNDLRYVQRIRLDVLNDGLMVAGIASPHQHLLGSRLLAVNGVAVDDLAARMKKLKPSENRFGNLSNLSAWGNQDVMLRKLGALEGDSVSYRLLTPQADTVVVTLPLVDRERVADVEMARLSTDMELPDANLDYGFIGGGSDIMYFRLSRVMARENYKYCYRNGWADALDNIKYYYQGIGKEMPADPEEALAGIPSISERFSDMLRQMKDSGAKCLVIDMRGNGGGWTPITRPTMMMMYGDEYFGKDFGVYSMRLMSGLYLRKINTTIDKLAESWGFPLREGDYITMRDFIPDTISNLRAGGIARAMTETPDLLKQLDGKPLYRPESVYVLTDANTNSAAFHYAFYLSKLGATLVGVPSSQAPNTFMEVTPFSLPCTGLKASVSNTMQRFYPDDSPNAKVLKADVEVTAADYARNGLDANTPVKMALDHYRSNH